MLFFIYVNDINIVYVFNSILLITIIYKKMKYTMILWKK